MLRPIPTPISEKFYESHVLYIYLKNKPQNIITIYKGFSKSYFLRNIEMFDKVVSLLHVCVEFSRISV